MFYLDSSDPKEVEALFKLGVLSGVTTNPLIISREMPGADLEETIRAILAVSSCPVSVELTETSEEGMLQEAHRYRDWEEDRVCIKVPVNEPGLRVIQALRQLDDPGKPWPFRINATCIMTPMQALLAAKAGANYVSLFWGRIADMQVDPAGVVQETRKLLNAQGYGVALMSNILAATPQVQIIVGSIRQAFDVTKALEAGADIVTVPPKILRQLVHHPRTAETIAEFAQAWKCQEASCKR